ncbi:MAG: helix-turn-helix transcriptional regulator [Clostridiales bacterium]|nr:helix-turn-helix transcriptional regulator [Clostridiales bacterium]
MNIDLQRLLNPYTYFVDYPCSELLKKVRRDLSLSQDEIAKDIGVSQTAYSGWERGVRVSRCQEYQNSVSSLQKRNLDVDGLVMESAY